MFSVGLGVVEQITFDQTLFTLLDVYVSSLRRGHANLLRIVPILMERDYVQKARSITHSAALARANAPRVSANNNTNLQ